MAFDRKYNKYDLSGEFGIGWTSNTNKEFYFDLEDYSKIKDYCWREYIPKDCDHVTLRTRDRESGKNIMMHHLVFEKNCDHINRNPLDNRKSNLRPASFKENARNSSVAKNNTSGITGVTWNKRDSIWQARIGVDCKSKSLGYFNNKEDAIKARLNAENEYYGEFAPRRHLFKEYGITTQN